MSIIVTLSPREKYRAGRKKDNIEVTLETWNDMQQSGLANNWRYVGQSDISAVDNERLQKVEELTKKINENERKGTTNKSINKGL